MIWAKKERKGLYCKVGCFSKHNFSSLLAQNAEMIFEMWASFIGIPETVNTAPM